MTFVGGSEDRGSAGRGAPWVEMTFALAGVGRPGERRAWGALGRNDVSFFGDDVERWGGEGGNDMTLKWHGGFFLTVVIASR